MFWDILWERPETKALVLFYLWANYFAFREMVRGRDPSKSIDLKLCFAFMLALWPPALTTTATRYALAQFGY